MSTIFSFSQCMPFFRLQTSKKLINLAENTFFRCIFDVLLSRSIFSRPVAWSHAARISGKGGFQPEPTRRLSGNSSQSSCHLPGSGHIRPSALTYCNKSCSCMLFKAGPPRLMHSFIKFIDDFCSNKTVPFLNVIGCVSRQ